MKTVSELPKLSSQMEAELRKLADAKKLTPDNVIKLARNPKNPLSQWSGWKDFDVAKAATEYWREAARRLIRSFKVKYLYTEETTKVSSFFRPPPAFVRDARKNGNEQGYVAVSRVKTERDLASETLVEELARMVSLGERVAALAKELKFNTTAITTANGLLQKFSEQLTKGEKLAS